MAATYHTHFEKKNGVWFVDSFLELKTKEMGTVYLMSVKI
jgi:hypothetical protein